MWNVQWKGTWRLIKRHFNMEMSRLLRSLSRPSFLRIGTREGQYLNVDICVTHARLPYRASDCYKLRHFWRSLIFVHYLIGLNGSIYDLLNLDVTTAAVSLQKLNKVFLPSKKKLVFRPPLSVMKSSIHRYRSLQWPKFKTLGAPGEAIAVWRYILAFVALK